MGVISSLKKLFCKVDCYDSLKQNSDKNDKIIKIKSELCGDVFFSKINAGQWRTIDAMKTSLANSILSEKLSMEEACKSNYVFDLIRFSWVDSKGVKVIDSEDRFQGLSNGDICAEYVNELSKLALEVNGFIINPKDLKKK